MILIYILSRIHTWDQSGSPSPPISKMAHAPPLIPIEEEWVKYQWTCLPNKQKSPIILVHFHGLF
jgi:hypothetical protein